jgi:hypothetical protein
MTSESSHAFCRRRILYGCLLCCIFLAAVASLLRASYVRARHRADALMARAPDRWTPYSSRLCLLRSLTGRRGLSWDFSYDSQDYFVVIPITLNVTLSGEVAASNPPDVLPKLAALR